MKQTVTPDPHIGPVRFYRDGKKLLAELTHPRDKGATTIITVERNGVESADARAMLGDKIDAFKASEAAPAKKGRK